MKAYIAVAVLFFGLVPAIAQPAKSVLAPYISSIQAYPGNPRQLLEDALTHKPNGVAYLRSVQQCMWLGEYAVARWQHLNTVAMALHQSPKSFGQGIREVMEQEDPQHAVHVAVCSAQLMDFWQNVRGALWVALQDEGPLDPDSGLMFDAENGGQAWNVFLTLRSANTPPAPVGSSVSAPVPIFTPEAESTVEQRRANYSGVCLVKVTVDTDGNAQDAQVVGGRPITPDNDGHPQNAPVVTGGCPYGLDQKAIEAVRKYKFNPARTAGGVPVPVAVTIELNFRLY
jgi:TonB family protein